MRLPINIEELFSGRAVEGDRIEYKTGWNVTEVERRASLIGMPRWSNVIEYNPVDIYHSLCAFANFAPSERRVKLAWVMPSQNHRIPRY